MRTCFALWHDHILARLSQSSETLISEFVQGLLDNNIVALFDGSCQSRKLAALLQGEFESSLVELFDYESEARRALTQASSASFSVHPRLPFDDYQLRILDKLRTRHLSILASDSAHWSSIYLLYNRFLEFINSNQIERVIFSEYPHTIYDYLFSLACINSDVKSYALQFVGQLGRSYSYIIDMNSHSIIEFHSETCSSPHALLYFLDAHREALTYYSPSVKSLYASSRDMSKREAFQLASHGHDGFTLWSHKQANALRTYNLLVKQDGNLPDQAYGIFFLHVEPESTVTPVSGFFSDQAVAVFDFYNLCLQRGLVPCIKEHPHQYHDLYPFSSNYHWQSHPTFTAAKSSEFYLKLKQDLPRLNFLPITLNPEQILKDRNYLLTGTLNGTIGVQSIFSGKEVIEYGLSWYQFHPLVTSRRYDTTNARIYTEAYSRNPVLNTMFLDADSRIQHYISSIVALLDRASLPNSNLPA